ncbi:MAG: septum site-determining protein MinC [Candidatus Sericytochromatia bacterium]|nr:septum site-determining protein MinC [Candidatus Sericytochromatia bacterium]
MPVAHKVVVKGTKDGLLIMLPSEAPWNELVRVLGDQLDAAREFWQGAVTQVDVGAHVLDEPQIKRLQEMLNKRYQLQLTALFAQDAKTRTIATQMGLISEPEAKPEPEAPASRNYQNNALYLRQTLRSGQIMRHDGTVVISGDVNPGGEVVATGDIVVLGTLRGVAHAGAKGDESAQITAINLRPTQLRIAGYIARSPDHGDPPLTYHPEYAWVSGGEIHIAPLRNRNLIG